MARIGGPCFGLWSRKRRSQRRLRWQSEWRRGRYGGRGGREDRVRWGSRRGNHGRRRQRRLAERAGWGPFDGNGRCGHPRRRGAGCRRLRRSRRDHTGARRSSGCGLGWGGLRRPCRSGGSERAFHLQPDGRSFADVSVLQRRVLDLSGHRCGQVGAHLGGGALHERVGRPRGFGLEHPHQPSVRQELDRARSRDSSWQPNGKRRRPPSGRPTSTESSRTFAPSGQRSRG